MSQVLLVTLANLQQRAIEKAPVIMDDTPVSFSRKDTSVSLNKSCRLCTI